MSKPLVLIISCTGRTGSAITEVLVKSSKFRLASVVRQDSLPKAAKFKEQGVEIRVGDIAKDDEAALDALVAGVDILLLTVMPFVDQRPILLAAKRAGVKRVVPSDLAPPNKRGDMEVSDKKLDIREFIVENNIPYTFIDIGLWTQFMCPWPHATGKSTAPQSMLWDGGKVPIATTSLAGSTGKFVERIIDDPRTLNKYVITWDHKTTPAEIWKVAEKVTGENFDDYPRRTKEEALAQANSTEMFPRIMGQYYATMYIRGTCTVEYAQESGALDARELYPDYVPPPLEQVIKEYYESL